MNNNINFSEELKPEKAIVEQQKEQKEINKENINKKYEGIYFDPRDLTLSEENDLSLIPKKDLVEYEKAKNEFDRKNENINLFFTLMERLNVECEKMRKNKILKKILFKLLVKRQEFMFYVLKKEFLMYSFEKEANLLKEIEGLLNSFNSQFFKFAEIYESGQKLDDECFKRVKDLYSKLEDLTKFYVEDNLFKSAKFYRFDVRLGDECSLHVKDLYNKLEDLPKFYGEDCNREIKSKMEFLEKAGNNTNYYLNYKLLKGYIISRIEEVDEYYEFFMDCFYKIAEYLDGFSFEKPKNFINKNGDEPITIFKDIKVKKKNLKYISFMDLYLKLYNKRNFFRRVLAKCYRLHLDVKDRELSNREYIFYIYDLVLKEKQNLKYLFSYLENLVRYYNLGNVKNFRNKLNLEKQFNLNNEFNEKYDPDSEESYPVEFKYNVYSIAEGFYEKNSKQLMEYFFDINLRKPRGNVGVLVDEYTNVYEYLDWRKMHFFMYKDKILNTKEEFIDGLKDASKNERNSSCFKFLKEVFKNLEDEMKKGDYSKNYGYKKLKGLINTLLFMETYEYGDFEFGDKNKRMLEEDILRARRFFQFFDDKNEKNKELCDFLLKYSKDKENVLKNSSKEIAEFFSNELKNELKKVKNEPVKGRNLLTGRSTDYPTMFNKDKFAIDFSEDVDRYITNHLNNGKEVTVEDSNFNEIYEKIESLVDKEGNLKRDFVNVEYSKYHSEALNELSEKLSELIKFLIEGINLYRSLKKS